jgi:hypothetical protein
VAQAKGHRLVLMGSESSDAAGAAAAAAAAAAALDAPGHSAKGAVMVLKIHTRQQHTRGDACARMRADGMHLHKFGYASKHLHR